jgi:hypothetical protein
MLKPIKDGAMGKSVFARTTTVFCGWKLLAKVLNFISAPLNEKQFFDTLSAISLNYGDNKQINNAGLNVFFL